MLEVFWNGIERPWLRMTNTRCWSTKTLKYVDRGQMALNDSIWHGHKAYLVLAKTLLLVFFHNTGLVIQKPHQFSWPIKLVTEHGQKHCWKWEFLSANNKALAKPLLVLANFAPATPRFCWPHLRWWWKCCCGWSLKNYETCKAINTRVKQVSHMRVPECLQSQCHKCSQRTKQKMWHSLQRNCGLGIVYCRSSVLEIHQSQLILTN